MRCPLTIRFGKDIAMLISLVVWKAKMRDVCADYRRNVKDEYGLTVRTNRSTWLYVNRRWIGAWSSGIRSFKSKSFEVVADLPANYW
jgi:hypothetical protein